MLVTIQRRIIFIHLLVIYIILICEGRSNSHLSKAVNKFESLSQTYKVQNESSQINLDYFHIVKGISMGIEIAVEECKNQFKWDRWNCPVESPALLAKEFVSKATRETAYVQAISAAGIMYHVSKKCNHPNNKICGCNSKHYKDMRAREDRRAVSGSVTWKWKGCMENVWFGEKVSHVFLGTETDYRSSKHAIKTHNEKAGMRAVTSSLKIRCKCHGPTGGCTLKTCWRVLPTFTDIAAQLKKKYKKAKSTKHRRTNIHASNKVRHRRLKHISKGDLVYSETSPDYCEPDNTIGYQGTHGRECKRLGKGENKTIMTKWERNSCKRLCKSCGYKVSRYPTLETETYDCECAFQWCCTVSCKKCQKKVWRYFCR